MANTRVRSAVTEEELQRLTEALLHADPDIRRIVLFGSTVYAPELARDVDVLVQTDRVKDDATYRDAAQTTDRPIDLIVRDARESLSGTIQHGVRAWGQILFTDGTPLEEGDGDMTVPTFADAQEVLFTADELLANAVAEHRGRRDYKIRNAFNALFDAARAAAQAYLNTENSRWGELRRQLPSPFDFRFREIVNKVHVEFAYDGKYPREAVEATFAEWREYVAKFIDDLSASAGEVK